MLDAFKIYINNKLDKNFDLITRTLQIDIGSVDIIFINSISDTKLITKSIIEPLTETRNLPRDIEMIKREVITCSHVGNISDEADAVEHLISGYALILFEFYDIVIYCDVRNYAFRPVQIPPTDAVIKGPREGFTESLMTNISLIRKRLRDADLKCEGICIGEKSETEVVIVYIQNEAPAQLVDYIKSQIKKIKPGYALQISHISEKFEVKRTTFDTIAYTEKPDIFVSKITEGRVGILIEGDPFAITAPCFFLEKFQSPNDYATNQYVASLIRMLRWIAFIVALLLPGLYIALITHHFSLIPRILAFRIAIARAGVPYPAFIEVFLLMFFFQLLRESGVRLPQPVGQAISIVGALILGDTAVQSGLASTISVILVALCSISSFIFPTMSEAVIIWANILVLCSALQGLPGYFIGFGVFCAHLAGMTSCGYPYLYPLGTLNKLKFKDHFIRFRLNEISNNIFKEDENS